MSTILNLQSYLYATAIICQPLKQVSTLTIMGWSRVEAWFYLRLMTTVPPVVMSTLRHKPASVHRKKQSIGIYI